MSTTADPDVVGHCCEYLDKEMTIIGLLTAFSIGVPILDRLSGAKPADESILSQM